MGAGAFHTLISPAIRFLRGRGWMEQELKLSMARWLTKTLHTKPAWLDRYRER